MAIPSAQSEVLVSFDDDQDRFLPEGPRSVVVEDREALIWVNIQTGAHSRHGAIHLRFWDNGERRALPQPSRPGFVMPTDQPGMVVVGQEKEVGLLDLSNNRWTPWATIPDENPRTIINDGEIVPGGRAIVFGTKDVLFANPIARLYLFTLDDFKIRELDGEQTCSNGKFFRRTDDELHLFDIDTPKQTIVRYRLDMARREIGDARVVLDLHDAEGFPDGMVACADGSAIVAFYNPGPARFGKAVRYSLETGAPIEQWTTPDSPRLTCPLLVKRNENVQLVLTTADEGMAPDLRAKCPKAGNLFIAETTMRQLPFEEVVRLDR